MTQSECSHGAIACERRCNACGHRCFDHKDEGCEGAGHLEEVCYCERFENPGSDGV